jgi:hypothetical protein
MSSAVRYNDLGSHSAENSAKVWGFIIQTCEVFFAFGGLFQRFFTDLVFFFRRIGTKEADEPYEVLRIPGS